MLNTFNVEIRNLLSSRQQQYDANIRDNKSLKNKILVNGTEAHWREREKHVQVTDDL